MKNLSLAILSLFLISCENGDFKNKKTTPIPQTSENYIDPKNYLICSVDLNNSKWIVANAKKIITLSDSCIFKIIDSIKIKSYLDKKYYDCLNSLYVVSDGDISEYFIDVMTEIFYKDYKGISEYLYLNSLNKLQNILVEALSMDVSNADNPNQRRANILKIIKERSKDENIKLYMLNIEKKINPKMFD